MNSSSYSLPYSVQDLGKVHVFSRDFCLYLIQTFLFLVYDVTSLNLLGVYPNATGNNASHSTQIEQSANMIIMSLAYAQSSGRGLLLSDYVDRRYYFLNRNFTYCLPWFYSMIY